MTTRTLASATAVRAALADVDFPATKDELETAAARTGADEPVIRALRALPLASYENTDEVIRSMDTAEGKGQTASQRGRQSQGDGPAGLAQQERSLHSDR